VKKIVIGVILFCASAVQANIVVSYDYNSSAGKDPTLQGWTLGTERPGFENGSYDATTGWRVTDAVDPGYTRYDKTFTSEQIDELTKGWIANWTFSLDADRWSRTGTLLQKGYYLPQPHGTWQNDGGLSIAISKDKNNTMRYCLFATADSSGNLAINDGKALHVLTSGGNGFDVMTSVKIVYDGTAATMYCGGQTFNLNQATPYYTVNRVRFGTQNIKERGGVVYNTVTLSTIPEPATMVLLGLGGLLCRRFKHA
jgi:hypothetical protein